MPSLSERLDRLHEQRLELPAPKMMEHLGIWYAVFNTSVDLLYYEEMLPEAFQEFYIVCFGGEMNAYLLGRMQ